ncbi:MAG: hypothetical protein KME40_03935 [Komarekiella atlantica HA4396-MV6]|nr:hypothetical protein [Komarekiella atlantica HA4396-MV6]
MNTDKHSEKYVACFPTERYANPQGASASGEHNFSRQRKVLRREVAIAQRKAYGMATLRASHRASEGFPPSKLRLGFPSLTRR